MKKINYWIKINFAFYNGLEVQYKNINRKIIAEEYIENNDNNINDYIIWCFDGKIEVIMVIIERKKIKKYVFFVKKGIYYLFIIQIFNKKKLINQKI